VGTHGRVETLDMERKSCKTMMSGEIVERDPNIYDTFRMIDAKVRALKCFGGDWGFEEV
jgi:hypothetical protein